MGFEARPVVIDVHVPGGVAGLRGLSAANLAPAALGRGWMDAGIWSRHAITRAVARNRGHRVGGLGAALERLTAETGGPVVPYPSTELGVDLVAEASRSSASVIAPFPLGAVECFRTKSRLGELAAEAGVRVPPGLRAPAAELRTGRIAAVTPCAVKSDRPVGTLRSTRVAQTPADLRTLLSSVPDDEELLLQPRVNGPLHCLAVVLDRTGRVVGRFQHLATSIWPPLAGSTATGHSVVADESLVEGARRVLSAAGYWGLAQLDFLYGPDGPVLIDVNPRFYSSLALALASGVNLPAAWHAVTVDQEVPTAGSYQSGVSFRWLKADLSAAVRGRPGRVLRSSPAPKTGAIWDAGDPLPGVFFAFTAVVDGAKGRLRAVR